MSKEESAIFKEKRQYYDYYKDQHFLFRIGYVQYLEAHAPMTPHNHVGLTEFNYMERGSQIFQVAEEKYFVNQGDVFFTHPSEFHHTGGFPEEVSSLYYFIIDLPLVLQMNIMASSPEYALINRFFHNDMTRVFKASPGLPYTLKRLLECFPAKDSYFDTHIRNSLSEVLIALATPCVSADKQCFINIERSLRYIDEHLSENILVSDLASLDNLSLSAYNKYFLQATGLPPGEYITRKKIDKSKELLADTTLSITEISNACGFSSSQYFATVFKRFCCTTPTEYRNSHKVEKKIPF